jgi:hypothetical protein
MSIYIYGLFDKDILLYVGKTNNPDKRFKEHLAGLKKSYIGQSVAYKKLRNHKDITFDIIDFVDADEWEFWECFYIAYFKFIGIKLYNVSDGGKLKSYRTRKERYKAPADFKINNDYYTLSEIQNKLIAYNIPINDFLKYSYLTDKLYQSILVTGEIPTLLIKQRMYFAIKRFENLIK